MYYDLPMYVRMDVVCSATRRTRVSENQEVRETGEPCAVGDVVVGRVASVGRHGVIETVQGLERPIGDGRLLLRGPRAPLLHGGIFR